jgi:N utilization substance protein A
MKGMRVQSIIRELKGEKIDIIEYSDDPVVFATHALSPAKISRVSILDPAEKHMEVVVDDTQLSLAIGKKGQNVRLAAKLLAWKIDIKSEEEKRQEVETQMAALVVPGAPVSVLVDHGLSEPLVEKLVEAGISTVEKLGSMTPEELEALPEIEPGRVQEIQQAVNAYYSQFETAEPAGPAEEVVPDSGEWPEEAATALEPGAETGEAPAPVDLPAARVAVSGTPDEACETAAPPEGAGVEDSDASADRTGFDRIGSAG